MSIVLPAEPLSLQSSAAWSWLMETAAAAGQALRKRRTLSPAEARLYAAAEALGAYVLDAQGSADLHARLYAIARDPRFITWEFRVFHELDLNELPAPAAVERTFAEAFGPTHLAMECAHLLAARIEAVAQALAALGEIELPDDAAEVLDDALSDFRTPPVVRSLFEETVTGEVALLALLANFMDAERWPCPPWLRLALLEQIRGASVSHLRLLSVLPRVRISEALLPLDQRLDQMALDRESQELSRFLLPADLPIGEAYVGRLRDQTEGDSPAPPGVRTLFTD